MQDVVRRCPQCNTDRSQAELFCEYEIDGQSCGWSLSDEPLLNRHAGSDPITENQIDAISTIATPDSSSNGEPSCDSVDTTHTGTTSTTSTIDQTNDAASTEQAENICANGHEMPMGDILCLECGATARTGNEDQVCGTPIDGWSLLRQLPSPSDQLEVFLATRVNAESDTDKRFVAYIFAEGLEPDLAVYPILERSRSQHLPILVEQGRSRERHFQIWQEFAERTLADLIDAGEFDKISIRDFVSQIGAQLSDLTAAGIRHRDLRPCNILIGSDAQETPNFYLRGLCSAIMSQLDIVQASITPTIYSGPELIIGTVSSSSDWWSLGMIVLQLASKGSIFEDVNEKAFHLHVIGRGVQIPDETSPELVPLLIGLLNNDHGKRWQWQDVQRWLRNEIPPVAASRARKEENLGTPISLGEKDYYSPESFSLATAEGKHWNEALDLLLRGNLSTWLEEQKCNEQDIATIRSISLDATLSEDLRLAFCLLVLNKNLPLSIRGEIVNPQWLLRNIDLGNELITGSRITRLRQLEREPLLQFLGERASNVRRKIELFEVVTDEQRLRECLLAPRPSLEMNWARMRAIFPDSTHGGVEALLQRRSQSEEDQIILLSTPPEYFVPMTAILDKAERTSKSAGWKDFNRTFAQSLLVMPRGQLYEALDELIDAFARCEIETLDDWADSYRMEKRIRLDRALTLLSVPKERWKKPPKQQYVSNVLGFFEKKILNKVNRGPLVRQVIARTTAMIDMMEIGSSRKTTEELINHLLARSDKATEIDPLVLDENLPLANRMCNLIRKTHTFTRDTGRHGLFLGFPYIVYQSSNTDESTSYKAAPLMLWPVRIDSTANGRGRIRLLAETQREEVRLNPALEGILGANNAQMENWKRCADEVIQRATSLRYKDVLNSFAQVTNIASQDLLELPKKDTELGGGKNRFVTATGVLFNCDFSGKSIADDLRYLKERPLDGTSLERMLKITKDEYPQSSSSHSTAASEHKQNYASASYLDYDHDYASEHKHDHEDTGNTKACNGQSLDHHAVMDLDPSQSEAVLKANHGAGLHIEGPPGTGKSQTIVNMIADAVSRGETVLVVCQKQAALSIVEKRLKANGLENRLFLISDIQKDRQPILKAFRSQLEQRRGQKADHYFLRYEHQKIVKRIESLEKDINEMHQANLTTENSIGRNYREILSELISIEESKKFVPVSKLRPFFQAQSDVSDIAVWEIADLCAGVSRLWLESIYEDSVLHPIRQLPYDPHTEEVLDKQLALHIQNEENRESVLKTFPRSPDVSDLQPVQNWLAENLEELEKLSTNDWSLLNDWISFFPIDSQESRGLQFQKQLHALIKSISLLDKSAHNSNLYSCLFKSEMQELASLVSAAKLAVLEENDKQRKAARWQILRFLQQNAVQQIDEKQASDNPSLNLFNSFISREQEREQTLHETKGCFDTSDPVAMSSWLTEHSEYFRLLSGTVKANLSRWIHLFDDNKAGLQLIEDLAGLIPFFDSLDPQNHNDTLFEFLKGLSKSTLSNWVTLAHDAMIAESPFKAERDKRLKARWQIIKSLVQSRISDLGTARGPDYAPLKAAIEGLIQAEEARQAFIQSNEGVFAVDDGEAFKEWLNTHQSFFYQMQDKSRLNLAVWFQWCEEGKETQNLAAYISSLESLQEEVSSLNPNHHIDELFLEISNLTPYELTKQIATARQATHGHFLNPMTLISKWKSGSAAKDLGAHGSLNPSQLLGALELEADLKPLRDRAAKILKELGLAGNQSSNQSSGSSPGSSSSSSLGSSPSGSPSSSSGNWSNLAIRDLTQTLAESIAELKSGRQAIQAIQNCPARARARNFVFEATKAAFEKFVKDTAPAIELCRIRGSSLDALKVLSAWLDDAAVQEFTNLIKSLDNNYEDLKSMWSGLPLFNDASMELFLRAAALEECLASSKDRLIQVQQILKEPRDQNLTLMELRRISQKLHQELSDSSLAFSKLQSCPCDRAEQKLIYSTEDDSFSEFSRKANAAIRRFYAREKSKDALQPLDAIFEDSWIAAANSNISNNVVSLAELRALLLPLGYAIDSTFEIFLQAALLELALKKIRQEYRPIASELGLKKFEANLDLFSLEQQASELSKNLDFVADICARLNSAPLAENLRSFTDSASTQTYERISEYLCGVVERFESKETSRHSLETLSELFEPAWTATQHTHIDTNKISLPVLQAIKEGLPTLNAFLQYRARINVLNPKCVEVLALCSNNRNAFRRFEREELADVVKGTIRRDACLYWKEQIEAQNPQLLVDKEELEQKVLSLVRANDDLTELNKRLILHPDWSSRKISNSDDEWRRITLLTGRNMVRLREFLERGTELGLLNIRPIWLMNPEVASRLLPLQKSFFDKVIFDEASQLPVEYALPALYRAKQVIVSGDEKQMPPSDFFTAKSDGGSDEEDEPDDENEDYLSEERRIELEEKWNQRDIKDCPDLLSLSSNILPTSSLEIHYRSEYRELISFSNAAFYSDALNVPCRHPAKEIQRAKPIEVIRANSLYKKRTNEGEARRVIEELRKVWRQNPRPSVGIVTFNLQQADLIEDLLCEEAADDPKFAQIRGEEDLRQEDGEDMGFFVKNLENVQGDERDIIIFSTTFGRNEKGEFRRNFGKVAHQGGERRLNVAVTRAKRKVILVTSLASEEISDCISKNRKPKTAREFLHCYIDYACKISDGNLELGKKFLERLHQKSAYEATRSLGDGFVGSVRSFVDSLGYESVPANDQSAFGLDLAIVDPKTGLFGIGIECDSPEHYLLDRAYHREVWRQSVLKRSVKKIHRITSRNWYHDRKNQERLLQRTIQEAMS